MLGIDSNSSSKITNTEYLTETEHNCGAWVFIFDALWHLFKDLTFT